MIMARCGDVWLHCLPARRGESDLHDRSPLEGPGRWPRERRRLARNGSEPGQQATSGAWRDDPLPEHWSYFRAWMARSSRAKAFGAPRPCSSRSSSVGKPDCVTAMSVLASCGSKVNSIVKSKLDPSGRLSVVASTSRRGRSITSESVPVTVQAVARGTERDGPDPAHAQVAVGLEDPAPGRPARRTPLARCCRPWCARTRAAGLRQRGD